MTEWLIGAHVIYTKGKYKFPGEVTMHDEDGGTVVKAFGDMEGNYSGMKHIYNAEVLEPYKWDADQVGFAPLVIFADDNPVAKIREWVAKFADRPDAKTLRGFVTVRAMLDNIDQLLTG